MGKILNAYIENMLDSKRILAKFIFKINNVDYSSYVRSRKITHNKDFGSAQATFILNNNDGIFGEGGNCKINLGDIVYYCCYYGIDNTEFKRFYGFVNQRSTNETGTDRSITLVCLDYIATLQFMGLDLEVEADKVEVTEETLTPNYLPEPNDSLAQVFNFANNSIADNPLPILLIKNKDTDAEDPLYDGMEILYDNGQVKLGFPLNAKDNYDLICRSYYYYPKGLYAEDILEEILIQPDSYDNYLFGESSAQDVIDNHLTEIFSNVKGTVTDTLYPNYTSTEITIRVALAEAVSAGDTSIVLENIEGLPESGTATINGDTFTWSGTSSGNTLTGIPATGDSSLSDHASGDYVEYTATYSAGQVWYLSFSNLVTDLVAGDFSIPGGTFNYFDKRFGRIILTSAISLSAVVTCTNDYTFKTLQTTGIEINKMTFRSREIANRLEAINKLREYIAPNFVIRTIGDEKIWASYLSQKVTADYPLKLTTALNFLEDEDLYTKVILYTKNKNPTNMLLGSGVSFVGTGESYKAIASNSELASIKTEDDYYIYGSCISDVGKIILGSIVPIVYLNRVPIDNKSHLIAGQQVVIEITTRTETSVSSGGK